MSILYFLVSCFSAAPSLKSDAFPHLGLFRLLPDRLPRLPSRPSQQPVDEPLVNARVVHLLRLVEPLVSAAALRHLGNRLPDGRLDGAEAKHAAALAHHQL